MKVDNLDKAIAEELDSFFNASLEDIREAASAAGKAAVKTLKSTSPGNKYGKGWKVAEENTRTGTSVIVYNKNLYMLAHLLEFGHPKVNGGRTQPIVHIQPAEKAAKEKFEKELQRRIENAT